MSGAVMVLFLFVVMMLDVNLEELRKGLAKLLAAGGRGRRLSGVRDRERHRGEAPGRPGHAHRTGAAAADYSNTRELGAALFTRYAYPAQIAAVILLVASVAAIVLTLRRRTGGKPQNIAMQVAVRAEDRIRIVKMASEKRP